MRARCAHAADARNALIKRQHEEIARLRDALTRAEHERDRLKRRNERLGDQLDAARRAGFRPAAPFAKPHRQGTGRPPGRRGGAAYGRHGKRPLPRRIDETHDAALPVACPGPRVSARPRPLPTRISATGLPLVLFAISFLLSVVGVIALPLM